METKVVKFGGSSLADAPQFRKVAAIIAAEADQRRYVVASAPGKRSSDDTKVTDLLYRCAQVAHDDQALSEAFSAVEARYNGIIADLGLSLSLKPQFDAIRTAIAQGAGADYVASRGEYLNAQVLAAFLGFAFVDAAEVIFFQAQGQLDDPRTYAALAQRLQGIDRAVIPGFYGTAPDGSIKVFSRGGSDVTGAIVARGVNASLYENWTDVSGMLMADPRIVENPRVIRETTYRELRELAYMGATVMHDEALFPVREANIPINIRNTNDPQAPGTMIVPATKTLPMDTVITGIAGRKGFSSITIHKDMMNTEVGFGRKLLHILEDLNISFEHTPTGIDTMSVVVSSASIADHKEEITARIFSELHANTVTIEDSIALLAVVGRGMVRAKGTAGRVLTAIAAKDINIRMIDQGAGEDNIILGVSEADYIPATQAIYDEFVR